MPPRRRRISQRVSATGPTKRAAAKPAPVANNAPAKRGRPTKKHVEESPVEAPRKRGRPPKSAPAPAPVATPEAPAAEVVPPKKRAGRPPKASAPKASAPNVQVAPVQASVPAKRRGRPSKAETQAQTPQPTRVSRHSPRAAKTTTPKLDRVAGPSRVAKRAKPSSTGAKAATPPRINARIRSKMRTRVPPEQETSKAAVVQTIRKRGRPRAVPQPTEQAKPAVQPSKRGRPPKAAANAATPKRTGRKVMKPTTPLKSISKASGKVAKAAAPTKVTKPVAPRKRRGYTQIEVPDRIVAMVEQYIHDLLSTDEPKTALVEERAEEPAETEPVETMLVDEVPARVEHEEEEVHITSASGNNIGDDDERIVDISDEERQQVADASGDEDEEMTNAIDEVEQIQQFLDEDIIEEDAQGSTLVVEEIVERIRVSEEAVQHLLESEPARELDVHVHVQEVIEDRRPITVDAPSTPDFEQFLHHEGASNDTQLDQHLFLHEGEHVVDEPLKPSVAAMY